MLNIIANINSARLMFTNNSVHRAELTFRSKVNAIQGLKLPQWHRMQPLKPYFFSNQVPLPSRITDILWRSFCCWNTIDLSNATLLWVTHAKTDAISVVYVKCRVSRQVSFTKQYSEILKNKIQPRLFPAFYKQNTNCGQTFAAHFSHIVFGGKRGE